MAWVNPLTWVVSQIVTAANLNTHIRDNLNYLKGVGQVPTIQSGLVIDNSLGSEYLKLPLLSTAEAATVLAAEGKLAHDEATHRIKVHDGTAVRSIATTNDLIGIAPSAPANTLDTIYQNGAKIRVVVVSLRLTCDGSGAVALAYGNMGASSPPTAGITYYTYASGKTGIESYVTLTTTLLVPPNYYYQIQKVWNTVAIYAWEEYDLF